MKFISPVVVISFSAFLFLSACVNGLQNNQSKEKIGTTWSGIPGDPDFSLADRMAIENVMDAYSQKAEAGCA